MSSLTVFHRFMGSENLPFGHFNQISQNHLPSNAGLFKNNTTIIRFIYLVAVNKNRRLRLHILLTIYFVIMVKVQGDSLEFVRGWLLIDHTIINSPVGLICQILLFFFSLFLFFFNLSSFFRPMILKIMLTLVLALVVFQTQC